MSHDLVAEFLREAKQPVQLVKHLDEVPESKIKYPIVAQIKYDGIFVLVVVQDNEVRLYSRTGLPLYYEYGTLHTNYATLPEGVYIGELCNHEVSLEVLSGLVNPNRKALWDCGTYEAMAAATIIQLHDYLTVDELLGGASDRTYYDRQRDLMSKVRGTDLLSNVVGNITLYNREDVERYGNESIARGYEGIVLKQDLDWVAGHKGYRAMKVVRGIHLDLLCVGVEYGKGKREGLVAALVLKLNEHTFKADLGKGWTDERRAELTESHELSLPDSPIGKIWEVKALQMSSTGKAMRLPKVVRIRYDKDEPDTV